MSSSSLIQPRKSTDTDLTKSKINQFLLENYVSSIPILATLMNMAIDIGNGQNEDEAFNNTMLHLAEKNSQSPNDVTNNVKELHSIRPSLTTMMALLNIGTQDNETGETSSEVMTLFRETFVKSFQQMGNKLNKDTHDYMIREMIKLEKQSNAFKVQME